MKKRDMPLGHSRSDMKKPLSQKATGPARFGKIADLYRTNGAVKSNVSDLSRI